MCVCVTDCTYTQTQRADHSPVPPHKLVRLSAFIADTHRAKGACPRAAVPWGAAGRGWQEQLLCSEQGNAGQGWTPPLALQSCMKREGLRI